ncbi:MAG: TonB-dependent receptor [Wenzhouxiangellaceae bacterium]|nr:MAG: TonB-dependent receptor [Wenzhouxiangellaceae bacterium]
MRGDLAMNTVLKCGILPLTLAVGAALAQQPLEDEGDRPLDTITVTGTRITGIDVEGSQPLIVISREDIESSGADNLIDLFETLTATGGGEGTFSTRTAGALSGSSPVGSAGVSLRGLGTASTLTLINGRRVAVASFANRQVSFVDINTIPLAAVDRVEILPSGASAIYGADAVAGVVNIILRNDLEGLELSASYGNSQASSNDGRYNINIAGGFQGQRSRTTLILDWFKREPLFDRDRRQTRNEIRPAQQGIFPSFNDLFLMWDDITEKPEDGGCPADQFVADGVFGEYCELNRGAIVTTRDKFESWSATGLFAVDISERLEWFNELSFARVESRGTSSPAPFSRVPVDPSRPDWPVGLVRDINAEGGVDDFSEFFGFPIFAWGAFPDPRQVEVRTDNFRLTTGLRGELGDWDWEGGLSYGRSESTQNGIAGLYRTLEFTQAMLGNLCDDGSFAQRWDRVLSRSPRFIGGASCEDLGRRTVLYNPFFGQADQDPLINDLLRTRAQRNGESEMVSFDLRTSGDLFQLRGRWVKAAFGYEHRYEDIVDDPSPEARSTPDNPEPTLRFSFTEAEANRRQNSAYAEFYVPLADNFELQLASRFDHYDDFGSDFNPKIAFRYQPLDQLVFRGSWSTSFRAPSLAQSGAGVTLSSFSIPCDQVPLACGGTTSGANVVDTELLGNPDLEPETARNVGLGFLWQISRNSDLTVDYWYIKHRNLVGLDELDFMRRAFAGEFAVADLDAGDAPLTMGMPGLIVEGGSVVQANVPLQNFGFQTTDGVDFSYSHRFNLGDLGLLRLTADATYLNRFDRQFSPTSGSESLAGEWRYPRWLADLSLRWRRDAWGARIAARYTGKYKDELEGLRQDTLDEFGLSPDDRINVGSWLTFNLNLSYDITPDAWLSLNIDNVLDRSPPSVFGSAAGVDFINHNTMGRYYLLRYTQRFQ